MPKVPMPPPKQMHLVLMPCVGPIFNQNAQVSKSTSGPAPWGLHLILQVRIYAKAFVNYFSTIIIVSIGLLHVICSP